MAGYKNQKCLINRYYIVKSIYEKFTSFRKIYKKFSEANSSPFFNDLVRVYGYIIELHSLNISYGKLIYWHIDYDNYMDNNGRNIIKTFIKSADVFHISNTNEEKID